MITGKGHKIGFRTGTVIVTVILSVTLLTACKSTVSEDQLLTDASNFYSTLATYYEDLETTTLDSWQNQSVYNALLGIPAPAGKNYEDRLRAVRERADLAHAVVQAFDSLKQLRDPSSASKVKTAGDNLGRAIQGTGNLPGAAKVATDEFGNVTALLTSIQRERDLKRALKSMGEINNGLQSLFTREERTYQNLNDERTATGEHLLEELASQKLVNPAALLQSLQVGLPVTVNADDKTRAAGIAIARLSVERANLAWRCATEQTAAVLATLSGIERNLERGEPVNVRMLEDEIGQANSCLKERDDLVKGK